MYQNIFVEYNNERKAIIHLWDDRKGYERLSHKDFDYAYLPDPLHQSETKSLYGVPVRKVLTWREDDLFVMEKDVPLETRVLTDLYLADDTPSINHRILFFDIEVSMREGLPDPNRGENTVYSIACWDSINKKYVVFALNNTETKVKIADAIVYEFDTEDSMLKSFMKYYARVAPTIISGWNSDYFDVPYIFNRLGRVLGPEAAMSLSPIGIVKYNKRRERYMIAGVASLDYMALYKKFTYNEQPTYRLDAIGEIEVKMKKVSYDGTLDDLYTNDISTFLNYNVQDVRILVKLDEKLKLIELVRGICHVGHVPYEDYGMSSRFLEGTIICYLHRKNIIVPNKPDGGREQMEADDESGEEGFKGAYVQEPIPGRYEWVYSLDLQSLYPSIIMSLNISPETKVGKVFRGAADWDMENFIKNADHREYNVTYERKLYVMTSKEEFVEFMTNMKLMISSNGILYTKEKVGVIPEILNLWFAQRVEFKNLMKKHATEGNTELEEYYDRRQHIQKIFLNSAYGVLGLPIFRFYDIDNALAVTATGQDIIKSSAKYLNRIYQQIPRPRRTITLTDNRQIYISDTSICEVLRGETIEIIMGKYLSQNDNLIKIDDIYI